MSKEEAYKIVYEDLKTHRLFRGIYDGKNGSKKFMNGVSLVMECVAIGVSEETREEFNKEFIDNMIKSES